MKAKKVKNNVLLLSTCLILWMCQQNIVKEQPKALFNVETVGKTHNASLDYIYNYIQQNKSADKISKVELLRLNKAAGMKYIELQSNGFSIEQNEEIATKINAMNQKFSVRRLDGARMATTIQDVLWEEVGTNLSEIQKQFISDIFTVLETSSVSTIQSDLDNIETQAYSDLTTSELQIVLSALSVAKNSSSYWESNIPLWQELTCEECLGSRTKIDWGWVVGADVAAAVTLGVGTSALAIAPFIGWAAWATITGGGAAIVSGATVLVSW